MNFIGHAYIARNHPELIAGNFAGDSYKGNLENFVDLPEHILNGVKLHRYIDHFTDTSPHIRKVGKIFQDEGVTKVGYIASDIILDHYLTHHWNQYHSVSYSDFITLIYAETDKNLPYLASDFRFLYDKLKEYGWFLQYPDEDGIEQILKQFSSRIGFENDLVACMDIYRNQKQTINQHFDAFIKSINTDSKQFLTQLFS